MTLNSWFTVSNNQFTVDSSSAPAGTYPIQVTASYDIPSVAEITSSHVFTFNLVVAANLNTAPVITGGCTALDVTVFSSNSGSITYTDTDSGDSHTLSILVNSAAAPAWITKSGFTITYAPTLNSYAGTYSI